MMANAYNRLAGFNEDLVIADKIQRACNEIFETFGHITRTGRKSLAKYGRNLAVTTAEHDLTPFNDTSYLLETHPFANVIDSISSTDAADTNKLIYLEGMTIDSEGFNFTSQVAFTDATNGQTRAPLATPLAEVTLMLGVAAGDVYAYENTPLTGGKPTDTTKIHNQLLPVRNSSQKCGTAIAKGNYFIILNVFATLGKASSNANADVRVKLLTLNNPILGNNFVTGSEVGITPGLSRGAEIDYVIVPPNSLVQFSASASAGSLDVGGGFQGIFADIVNPQY